MKYNPELHHRKSIRLKNYDYSQEGAYFITICVQNKECLFGKIAGGEMQLNSAGLMIEKWYFELEKKFSSIQCGEHVVMPNHFYCILIKVDGVCNHNVGADLRVCPSLTPNVETSSINKITQWFKTMTTNEYIRGVKEFNWLPFRKRLWQRNYYEHIIRSNASYSEIAQYIVNNPSKWEKDAFFVTWDGVFI